VDGIDGYGIRSLQKISEAGTNARERKSGRLLLLRILLHGHGRQTLGLLRILLHGPILLKVLLEGGRGSDGGIDGLESGVESALELTEVHLLLRQNLGLLIILLHGQLVVVHRLLLRHKLGLLRIL